MWSPGARQGTPRRGNDEATCERRGRAEPRHLARRRYQSLNVNRVKLYDAYLSVLMAFTGIGPSLLLQLGNFQICPCSLYSALKQDTPSSHLVDHSISLDLPFSDAQNQLFGFWLVYSFDYVWSRWPLPIDNVVGCFNRVEEKSLTQGLRNPLQKRKISNIYIVKEFGEKIAVSYSPYFALNSSDNSHIFFMFK